jgi:hypothetical protein
MCQRHVSTTYYETVTPLIKTSTTTTTATTNNAHVYQYFATEKEGIAEVSLRLHENFNSLTPIHAILAGTAGSFYQVLVGTKCRLYYPG